ncbi:MAG: signal recognition particle receptor subunit alpha [Candidatus Babeliaceae bacterium]
MFDFLSQSFSSIFSKFNRTTRLNEQNTQAIMLQVHDALLQADVPYEIVQQFIAQLKQEIEGQKLVANLKPAEQLIKIVHDKMVEFLGQNTHDAGQFTIPSVFMMIGLQGSGKTTVTAKFAHYLRKIAQAKGKTRRILVASVDFYRPAAIDQLEILAQKAGVDFYRAVATTPQAAAQEIYAYSQKNQYEYLLLDTAGRLHNDDVLMAELRSIDMLIKPRYKLLIVDAMMGQESLVVARSFKEQIDFYGAFLTKVDSDTRGGVAFAFSYALQKPLLFVGNGEKIDDLDIFNPKRMAGRILGMGDIESLLEKAQEKVKQADQDRIAQSMMQGKMTLQDFADQLDMMNKIGSMGQIMKYLPGMDKLKISSDMLEKGESEIKRFKAIINSMTLKERLSPKILNQSRKERIAKGAGVKVGDVALLLEKFEQSLQFVKIFKKTGYLNQFFK